MFHCKVGDDFRALYVVDNSLSRVDFHHRHMLIGCGVNHEFRLILSESLLHAHLVLHATYEWHNINFRELLLHLQHQVVHWGFGLVDAHHEPTSSLPIEPHAPVMSTVCP